MTIHVGAVGTSLSSLHPQGVIQIDGRRYPARAEHVALEVGTAIVVVGGDNCGLVVRAADPTSAPAGLPGFGEPVSSSFLERIDSQSERDTAEQLALRADRRRRDVKLLAVLGAVAAVVVLWLVWDNVTETPGPTWQAAVIALFSGTALGALVYLNLRGALARFDHGTGRIVAVCSVLALIGGGVGAALGIPAFGLVGGLALCVVGMFALGLLLPMLLVIGGDVGS